MQLEHGQRYDPFARGSLPVGVRTIQARDSARSQTFPCEIWYPAAHYHSGQDVAPETQDVFAIAPGEKPRRQAAIRDAAAQDGTYPLIVFSHGSSRGAGARRMATFVCTHLTSHGYLVAALDHSELVADQLMPSEKETAQQKAERVDRIIAHRPQDLRFLIEYLLTGISWDTSVQLDPAQVGLLGYSFGGWTTLAVTSTERRVKAVVALAPGGSSKRKPGIAPVTLRFDWGRDVPTLYLVGEHDTMTPLDGMYELFERTPATKRMVILHRADHMHFLDNVEEVHEAVRTMPWVGELAWIPREMRSIGELCSGNHANLFVRGLTLAHLDAFLRGKREAQDFLAGDLDAVLAEAGISAAAYVRKLTGL